ncbi:Uncharacterised protein [Enterobacter asburiae]|uniref:Uncharacterized protein n=1 Tax=Enterobacter asburiae TaxID=61645 RepID=A0A376FBE5_ENTAS|nr:Uncharacterised protein [Enterobacter asburiae]
MKGNIEEVATFFGLDGGDTADWLHRDDALSLVVVDHRLTYCISVVFNFVNVAVVLTGKNKESEIISCYSLIRLAATALLDDEVSFPFSSFQLVPEAFLDAIADIKNRGTATTLSERHTPRYASYFVSLPDDGLNLVKAVALKAFGQKSRLSIRIPIIAFPRSTTEFFSGASSAKMFTRLTF